MEISALLDIRHCPKLQSCAILRKTNDADDHNKKLRPKRDKNDKNDLLKEQFWGLTIVAMFDKI